MPQLRFDADIIEILNGRFFKLSSMRFTEGTPYKPGDLGKISPRVFKEVHPCANDGGCFAYCVRNSFLDAAMRTKFLVKSYHCLLAGQLPLMKPKICLVGPSDSGKSSMASVLFG